jgi:hypothetical protein
VKFLGVFAGKFCITTHGIVIDFQQATGFPHTYTFGDVFEDGDDGLFWQSRVEKNRSATFRKRFFAN